MQVALDDIVSALRSAGVLADIRGSLPREVTAITDDSRSVTPGSLFLAVRGFTNDGHDYLPRAERLGSTAAMVENPERTSLPAIVVTQGRRAAAIAAGIAYDEPSRLLRMIGITGTNGKSTTAGILRHLLDQPDQRSASIGTLGVLFGTEGERMPGGSDLTTPGPVELQRVLRALVDRGARSVAMEVSSHSLDQRRIDGLEFDAAVFTNLTRDHLDYHGTMENYFAAKARLVDYVRPDGAIAVNVDDREWDALPDSRRKTFFGVAPGAEVRATDVRFSPAGSDWTVHWRGESLPVSLPLIGDVNVHNALGAIAVGLTLGMPLSLLTSRLADLPQVPGRLELISERPTVLRDYAHTPDALDRALLAIRPFTSGRIIVVFGAGGDRDQGKRALMGHAAERGADIVIITSDNPRTEDPERILDDIEEGMTNRSHERIEDRHAAIERALAIVGDGDVVLLAGKGHETYQIRGSEKLPFDEKKIVRDLLASR
jgi:UDP-N-acetylmuramoyl-L-alanyl-D-glutamate--2,6-diaminopimelate ligase